MKTLNAAPAYPDLSGVETHYGIAVGYIGEDGAMFALGHHEDKRRVIAAMNRLARKQCGLDNMLDDPRARYTEVVDWLYDEWAIELADHCGECADDPECAECKALQSRSDDEWCLQWGNQGHPAAFPITMWRA